MPGRRDAAAAAGAMALALLACFVVLQLWNADMRVPFSYAGDGLFNEMIVKDVLDNGWYQENPSLGAPYGQELYDFPVVNGDNAQILLIKAIGLFSSDPALVMNLFFILTFPLVALTAFAAVRALGGSRPVALAVAVLYAAAPYHFIRGELHVFIGAYWAVPLGALLVMRLLGDEERPLRLTVPLAGLCVLIGSAHVYYAVFTMLLLAFAGLLRALSGAGLRPLAWAAAPAAIIALAVAVNHAPSVIHHWRHGDNPATKRGAFESEVYGLKVAAMTLPVSHHRIGPLADLRARYDDTVETQFGEGTSQALGLIATIGLVLGLLAVLAAVLPGSGLRLPPLVPRAGLGAAMAIAIGTVGGLSSIIAFLIAPGVRSWGRLSIFVAFFALLALAALAEKAWARLGGGAVAAAAVGAVLVLGVLEQTSPAVVPKYDEIAAAYHSDAAFTKSVETTLNGRGDVFQLPYLPFPEPQPIVELGGPYDEARPYLHSGDGLRWSWGAVKGRHEDWQHALTDLPVPAFVNAVAAGGFTGLVVDRELFTQARQVEARLATAIPGSRRFESRNGRLAFYDLRPVLDGLRVSAGPVGLDQARAAVLKPLQLRFTAGFSSRRESLSERWRYVQPRATFDLHNSGGAARTALFEARLAPALSRVRMRVRWPDGADQILTVGPEGAAISRRVRLQPGENRVNLATAGLPDAILPDVGRAFTLRMINPALIDEAVLRLGRVAGGSIPASFHSPFEGS